MKFCCESFQDKVNYVGCKGISIIPINVEQYKIRYYVIQYRNYDIGHESNFKTLSIGTESIKFCPWCGAELFGLIENDLENFKSLADKNEHFLTIPPIRYL